MSVINTLDTVLDRDPHTANEEWWNGLVMKLREDRAMFIKAQAEKKEKKETEE